MQGRTQARVQAGGGAGRHGHRQAGVAGRLEAKVAYLAVAVPTKSVMEGYAMPCARVCRHRCASAAA